MENKRGNFEKDKILEDILDNVSKGTTGQSSYSRTQYSRKNTSRNSGGSNIPRKTINPAARTSSISNTGFATANKTSTNYTEKIPKIQAIRKEQSIFAVLLQIQEIFQMPEEFLNVQVCVIQIIPDVS